MRDSQLKRHSKVSFILLIVSHAFQWVWTYKGLPHARSLQYISFAFGVYFLISIILWKKEIKQKRTRKQDIKAQIIAISDNMILQDEFTVDDVILLYEVDELEKIVAALKRMPRGHRLLQEAIDKTGQVNSESSV